MSRHKKGRRTSASKASKPSSNNGENSKSDAGSGVPGTGLNAGDRALWDHVVRSIKPSNNKLRVTETDSAAIVSTDSRETFEQTFGTKNANSVPLGGSRVSGNRADKRSAAQPPKIADVRLKAMPAMASFDRRTAKKIRKGRIELDGRIDLHGMRQAEAHAALRGFLFAAAGRGHRTVLVISGKGASNDDNTAWQVVSHNTGRGVLRRSVPMWLSEPELRGIVVSYTTADIRHGGDGAFYVQLKRRTK